MPTRGSGSKSLLNFIGWQRGEGIT